MSVTWALFAVHWCHDARPSSGRGAVGERDVRAV
jgi:hypothetical protein